MGFSVIFPGQGAQSRGLGTPWLRTPAWDIVERAEAVLDERLGDLLLRDPLESTREAQLAVLLASLMAWETRATSDAPVVVAGHSLGQVTALIVAGVVGFEDGIRLAARRAEVTQDAVRARPGRMVAFLGADIDTAESACLAAPGECWVANENAPGQVVIAGTLDGVGAAVDAARADGIRRAVPLKVDGAFHTPLMAPAREALARFLSATEFRAPAVPIVSNADAVAYSDGDGWRQRLADHLVTPVRWRQSVETMSALGVERFDEVGPGETLSAMVKRTLAAVA